MILDKHKHADVRTIKVDGYIKKGPVILNKSDTISNAVEMMIKHGTSGIPVVGETPGIITKTDIVKGIAEGKLP
jgi:CBS domain-containing protein